jgi:1-deoxy-D-xylulose-5-phosphate reductoisomerase
MAVRILILGSTGSIGTQTLEVLTALNQSDVGPYEVVGLSSNHNQVLLQQQSSEWGNPPTCLVQDDPQALEAFVKTIEADLTVVAVTGVHGVFATLAAIEAGHDIALANKETLVMAGEHVMQHAKALGVTIWPIDSEHAALFELLNTVDVNDVDELVLTCSGGTFRERNRSELVGVTAAEALQHPTWNMGAKITIDSATLMNKGFEIIEAHHLFGWPAEKITVRYHPQSIVHGLLKMKDGSWRAQASLPSMKGPIRQALTQFKQQEESSLLEAFPSEEAWQNIERFGQKLSFGTIDEAVFRGMKLCRKALALGGMAPAILTLENDQAVAKFLKGEIAFLEIYDRLEAALANPLFQDFSIHALRAMIEKASTNR